MVPDETTTVEEIHVHWLSLDPRRLTECRSPALRAHGRDYHVFRNLGRGPATSGGTAKLDGGY